MTFRCTKLGRPLALALSALLYAGAPAAAQPASPPGGAAAPNSPDRAGPPGLGRRGGGRLFLVLRIADALHLTDEQTIKVAASLRGVEEKRVKLRSDKAALEARLDAELAKKPIDEARVASLTQQVLDLDRQLLLLPEEMYGSIQGMLTVEQRARLLLLRSHMQEQVQRERERRGLDRSGEGDGSGPAPSPGEGGPPRRGQRRFFPG